MVDYDRFYVDRSKIKSRYYAYFWTLFLSDQIKTGIYTFLVVAFGGMGLYLVATGLIRPSGTVITACSIEMYNIIASLLAMRWAVII
jgi:hypothetical protein